MRINGKLRYDAKDYNLQNRSIMPLDYASFTGILSGGVSDAELRQRA